MENSLTPLILTGVTLTALITYPILFPNTTKSNYLNIYGKPLSPCSTSGTALTGYTRDGYCTERQDDSGSHHICIDLSSVSSSEGGDFCEVTGQSDWCSNENMPCHDDASLSECAIENWCVCQWAFASYIRNAGGCDYIQDISCDAINMEAYESYKKKVSYDGSGKIRDAMDCLESRCGLSSWFW